MIGARFARAGAVAIAIAAAIDPSWTVTRAVPVPVSMMYDAASAPFADRLRRELGGAVAVVSRASPDSQASILLRAPDGPLPHVPEAGLVFIVDDPRRASPIRIRSIDVPRTVLLGRTIPVTVQIDVVEQGAGTMTIELRTGDRLVASEERPGNDSVQVALRFAPAGTGLLPLRVDVTRGSAAARAESAVRVEDRKLRVLVVDPRPSWSSTFVRRALEADPAFDVSTETITSRGVSAVAGTPGRYDDPIAREDIDAVIAGTPSALTTGALRGLEAFARNRGGALVLLADQDAGRILEQLTGTRWQRRGFGEPVNAISAHGSFPLSDALLPSARPLSAHALATLGSAAQPLVQEMAIGNGRLIVSGALDAWRYRGAPSSDFAAFWRGVIGDAAAAAAPPMSVTLSSGRANPGTALHVEVVVRDARPGELVTVEATLEAGDRREPVRLWPAPAPGVFTARVAAPPVEGVAILKVAGQVGGRAIAAEAPLRVSTAPPLANVPASVPRVLASARGGTHIPDGDAGALREALRAAFPAHEAPVTTHPMRYAGWLVPFTLLLGYEWRWRRQRGLK